MSDGDAMGDGHARLGSVPEDACGALRRVGLESALPGAGLLGGDG